MARGTVLGRLAWKIGEVDEITAETPKVSSIAIDVPDWPGHLAGQHVDVRLTAEDGYEAQRSYSIASAPEDRRVTITVERLDDGEVSPYLVGELRARDKVQLRGPIGGFFVWRAPGDRPLLLIAGGSGVTLSAARFASRLADLYMERWTFESQRTGKPINGRSDNLYKPVATDGGERGQNWKGHTRESSVYTRAALHPRATTAVIAGLALGLGAAAAATRWRSEHLAS